MITLSLFNLDKFYLSGDQSVETKNNGIKDKKIGIIGVGTIGGTLVEALVKNDIVKPENINGSTSHEESAKSVSEKYGIEATTEQRSGRKSERYNSSGRRTTDDRNRPGRGKLLPSGRISSLFPSPQE